MKHRSTMLFTAVILFTSTLLTGCADQTMSDVVPQDQAFMSDEVIEDLSGNISNDYLIEDIQCIWGTWVITEVWAGQNCVEEDEKIGTIVEILPDSFSFGDDTSNEISGYSTEVFATKDKDEYFREIGTYGELGLTGDYFLKFQPKWDDYKSDIFPFTAFILLSETEMMIPLAGSGRILLEKAQDDQPVEADAPLSIGPYANSVCYGQWLISDSIKTGEPTEGVLYVGTTLQTSDKLESFTSCRVLGRTTEAVDELADLVGINADNQYVICYNLSDDYFWDQMICIDDMTAVLIKGNSLFHAKKISYPQRQEITIFKRDYLLAEVPELWDIAHSVHQKTGGQAYLQVSMIRESDHLAAYQGDVLPRYYDSYYAGVVWQNHEEEGIWFYVGKYEGEILCREDDEEELYTLEEWRASDGYAARMDAVVEWQQEKTGMLLASEGESLDEPWYEAYRSIIMDWTVIEDLEDRGWVDGLKDAYAGYSYSDFSYEFYSYWLCDIDRNGTPELFLWYPSRRLDDVMVILTYTDHPIVVGGTPISMEQIYGINVETGEIIIAGHWTGAGGSNEYEWSGYRMQGDTIEYCFYIDSYAEFVEEAGDTPYVVDYPERHGPEWQADGGEYEEIYENHVANCIPMEDIVMYDMMDLSGLKDIQ